jgi:hypothetical protein
MVVSVSAEAIPSADPRQSRATIPIRDRRPVSAV